MVAVTEDIMTKALFLDRDGVINVDHGYVHTIEDFDFVDGIFELTRNAVSKGYVIVVITNQSGIGRGYYSEKQFMDLSAWMCEQFQLSGAKIEKVYFSPFHPTGGVGRYRKDDFSRKPNPGMIFRAQQELHLDLSHSLLIGDKESDIEAGVAGGIPLNFLFCPSIEGARLKRRNQTTWMVPLLSEITPFL